MISNINNKLGRNTMDIFFLAIYFGNLLNYLDRGLISSLLPTLEQQFCLTKVEQGLLSSSFIIGYAIFSVIFSVLASRYNKRLLLIIGTCLWCISCLLMVTSTHKWSLYLARSISGIGEASYQSIVPVFLTDLYGEERGWRKTSIFFTAINIGFSLGILMGGIVKSWRAIYLGELVLGLVFMTTFYNTNPLVDKVDENNQLNKSDNELSDSDSDSDNDDDIKSTCNYLLTGDDQIIVNDILRKEKLAKIKTSECKRIMTIFTNPDWWASTIGYMFVAYSNGVLALWMPTYYKDNFSHIFSYTTLVGILSVTLLAAGTFGSILGNKITKLKAGNDFSRRYKLFKICAIAIITCLPFSLLSLYQGASLLVSVSSLFITLVCFAMINIPNGMISVTCVNSDARSYSTSLQILLLHLGGDMPSPIISSIIWEKTHNLRKAISFSLISLLFSGVVYIIGYRNSRRNYMSIKNREKLGKSLILNSKQISEI